MATHHTMGLNERRLDYEAVAETLPVTDAKGNTTASIFTVSYLTDGENGSARPVSFVFNGGPGAASVFLHLGALGPQILQTPENGAVPTPPVHLIDNPATWLGFTDLVFVDPVGTGFSRGKGKEENPDKPFWDVRADIASLGLGDPPVADPASALDFAGLARRRELWRLPGGGDGANPAARCRRDRQGPRPGLAGARPLGLASDRTRSSRRRLHPALLRRHRRRLRRGSCGGGIAEAERFALSDYLVGLAGLKGQPSAGDPLIARVAQIAGVPADIVRRYRGRIPRHIFAREIRRNQGEAVSLYDSTIAAPAGPEGGGGGAGDPVLQPAVAAYGTAFNAYLAEALGVHTDQPYRVLPHDVSQQWNWQGERQHGTEGLAMSSLEAALLEHPATKVLIVNGRYDLVTPYFSSRWLVDQLEIPAATRSAIRLRVYDGGHMVYMRPASRSLLAHDAAELYGAGEPSAPSQ